MTGTQIEGPDWSLSFPAGDEIMVRIPTCPPLEPGPHPAVFKRYDEGLEFKYGNPKRWVTKAGRIFITALPKSVIELVPECGHSWPKFWVGGHEYAFNVCGGTGGTKGWWDRIDDGCSLVIPGTLTKLRNLLDHACPWNPAWQARLPQSTAEQDAAVDAWYHEHRDHWVTTSATGDHDKTVPAGMVGVHTYLGRRPRFGVHAECRRFLVPEAEYSTRTSNPAGSFVVDPARHAVWVNHD